MKKIREYSDNPNQLENMKRVVEKKSKRPRIEKIEILHLFDNSPDTSWIGEFSNEAKEGAINHRNRSGGHRLLEFFNPANPEYAEQEYERMMKLENQFFYFMGIRARAVISIPQGIGHVLFHTVESPGLWGIESDSDDSYKREVAKDELEELRGMLKALNVNLSDFTKLSKAALDVEPLQK